MFAEIRINAGPNLQEVAQPNSFQTIPPLNWQSGKYLVGEHRFRTKNVTLT